MKDRHAAFCPDRRPGIRKKANETAAPPGATVSGKGSEKLTVGDPEARTVADDKGGIATVSGHRQDDPMCGIPQHFAALFA